MSNEPSGAIDKDFDESEKDARDILEGNLSRFAAEVKPGDIVIDMVENRPLFIRRKKAESAVEFFEANNFDLVTYKAHPWLPITPDDAVFECVFIPTKLSKIPTDEKNQTYDYPRGRLARVPVEYLWGSSTRYQDDVKAAFLAALFTASLGYEDLGKTDDDVPVNGYGTLLRMAEDVFDADVIDDALERSQVDVVFDDEEDDGGDE